MPRTRSLASRPRTRLAALTLVAVVAGAGLSLPVADASAQTPNPKNQPMTPPVPPPSRSTRGAWLEYILAVGMLALVVGANVLPSKRGHQD